MFALAAVPMVGAVGMAVDYTRAVNVQSFIQNHSDMAALNAVHAGPLGDSSRHIATMRSAIIQRYGQSDWIDQLAIEGRWLSSTDFRVSASGTVPVTFLAAVPGFPSSVDVSAVTIARIAEPKYIYGPPTVMELDPEAADYNRISVYCFDPTKKKEKNKGRSQETIISDNAGTKYTFTMPTCAAGEMMSYRLTNVRDARTNKKKWDDKNAERYDYYTDTTLKNGAEFYDLGGWDILETVLCDSLAECKGKSQGGIIPEGKDRIPQRTTKVCSPGKYMYYGWEDRPPGSGWTDRDYDDIRVIIGCPTVEEVGDRMVRLIQ